jgi:predicted Zn-dependent peptidase
VIRRLALAATVMVACRVASTAPPPPPTGPRVPVAPTQPEPPPEEPKVTQTATPQELVFPDEPFRAQQPGPGKARPFRLPEIKPFTLKSGVKVYLVEQHTVPIVSMDLSFDGGSINDPKGKEGLASVCMAMLAEGTEALDKVGLAEALADVAASVDAAASSDTQSVSMSSLTKHLDTVFPLFADVLRRPGFRDRDFERMIKRRLEALRQARGAAASIAGRVAAPILYGAEHPFGRVTTETSLQAITLDDCRAYHARWLKPKGARLFVVGDLTEARVRELFDGDAMKGWKGKVPKLPKLPAPKTRAGAVFFVDVPGAKQSEIQLMHFGPKRTADDYYQTAIMTAVLGVGFTSRINMNLREDKGYAYGARAGFSYSRRYGAFSAGSSVDSPTTRQAILELLREIEAIQSGDRPATEDELTREKASAVLAMPARFASASASLGTFRGLVYYGLPLDYYASYVKEVEAVCADVFSSGVK